MRWFVHMLQLHLPLGLLHLLLRMLRLLCTAFLLRTLRLLLRVICLLCMLRVLRVLCQLLLLRPLGLLLRLLRLLCTAFLLHPLRLLLRVSSVLHVLCVLHMLCMLYVLCMLCMMCLLGVLRQLLQVRQLPLRGVQRCLLHSWRRPEPAALRFLQQLQQPGPRRARLIGSPIVVRVGAHRLRHGLRLGRQSEPLLPLLYQRRLLRLPVSLIGRGVGRLREHRAWGMDACALGGTRSSWRRRRLRAGLPRVLLGFEILMAFYFID